MSTSINNIPKSISNKLIKINEHLVITRNQEIKHGYSPSRNRFIYNGSFYTKDEETLERITERIKSMSPEEEKAYLEKIKKYSTENGNNIDWYGYDGITRGRKRES